MFIGPFTVYLGGLLGPRRVLLFAAAVFTVTCAFLPLIHSYSLLVAALIVAGLTSGTFYPLTLTFALRIIPSAISAVHDGVLCHVHRWSSQYRAFPLWLVPRPSFLALDVLEFSPDCAGDDDLYLFRDTGGSSSKEERPGTQLRRIPVPECRIGPDVYRPPARTEARLVALRSIQRRYFGPARSSRYARSYGDYAVPTLWWRCLISGNGTRCCWAALLFWFRFTLTGTIILIPQSLAIHGFEADQIGPAIIWSAVPLLLVAFTAGLLLLRRLDPRLLLAAGLTCTAFAVCLNAEYTTRLVGSELLSHRAAHGRRTSVFSHRAGGMHHPAGNLHRGVGETSVDSDILCVLSHDSLVWWNGGRHVHGPLPCRTREAALEPSWAARDQREAGSRTEIFMRWPRASTQNHPGWQRPGPALSV